MFSRYYICSDDCKVLRVTLCWVTRKENVNSRETSDCTDNIFIFMAHLFQRFLATKIMLFTTPIVLNGSIVMFSYSMNEYSWMNIVFCTPNGND